MAEKTEKKEIDIDALLNEVKHVRASMYVAEKSIAAVFMEDCGYFELDAMLAQAKTIFDTEKNSLDRIINDLREAGAKDYNMNDNWLEEGGTEA